MNEAENNLMAQAQARSQRGGRGLISTLCVLFSLYVSNRTFEKIVITMFYNFNSIIFHFKIVITIVIHSDCIILHVIVLYYHYMKNWKLTKNAFVGVFRECEAYQPRWRLFFAIFRVQAL